MLWLLFPPSSLPFVPLLYKLKKCFFSFFSHCCCCCCCCCCCKGQSNDGWLYSTRFSSRFLLLLHPRGVYYRSVSLLHCRSCHLLYPPPLALSAAAAELNSAASINGGKLPLLLLEFGSTRLSFVVRNTKERRAAYAISCNNSSSKSNVTHSNTTTTIDYASSFIVSVRYSYRSLD